MPIPAAFADALIVRDDGSTAGYVTLAWPDATGSRFLLQQEAEGGWTVLYDGPDRASTLSGLEDGDYTFRLLADGVPVGDAQIYIRHHPLSRAWAFFGMGAAMFIALLALLRVGTRRRDGETIQ